MKNANIMALSMFIITIMMLTFYVHLGNCSPPLAPALYIFGDSLVDSGNNNHLTTMAKADYPPYGMNFENGRVTGRFTNGRTVADFTAEYLGLPYPPPYMSLFPPSGGRLGSNHLKGLNFASGSCGILPDTGAVLGHCLSLGEQMKYFTRIVQQELPKYLNKKQLSKHLSESIFLFSVGSNDYLLNYLNLFKDGQEKSYNHQGFARHLVEELSGYLEKLYHLGARKVVMFELGPLGCMPIVSKITWFGYAGMCNEKINGLSVMFNDVLAPSLKNLTSTLKGSSFTLGRVYDLANDIHGNPSKYGLKDLSNTCCPTIMNGFSPCIQYTYGCDNPGGYMFFDSFHPTETLYQIIADRCFRGSVCVPNIKALVS